MSLTALVGWFLLGVLSCSRPSFVPPFQGPETQVFGYSVEGRPIQGTVLGDGPRTSLLVGVIHGNEPIGMPLLSQLERYLLSHPELLRNRRVVIVPVVNPDGLKRGTRANANGIDLNRNFPSRCFTPRADHGTEPASEPETRTLVRLVETFQPERVLSIHSPLNCVNFDGPAREVARRVAKATRMPVRDSVGYPTPGAFGRYVGTDRKIPSITLELGTGLSSAAAWNEIRGGFVAFLESHPATDGTLTTSSRALEHDTGK